MKTPDTHQPVTKAIPPPPNGNETISTELAKKIIAELNLQTANKLTLSEIAGDIPGLMEANFCNDLQKLGRLGSIIYAVCFQFGEDKITKACLKSALTETQLHFCAKPSLMEYRRKKEAIQLTLALKKVLLNSLQGALLQQVISYEDLMEKLKHIGSYTDLEEAGKTCALMEELFIICEEFMDEFNNMEAINIVLAGLKVAAVTLQPIE